MVNSTAAGSSTYSGVPSCTATTPSWLSTRPFFRSFVVATRSSFGTGSEDQQVLRGRGQQLRRPLAHDEGVLDADSSAAGQVDAGLDGDRCAASESTGRADPQHRGLVDLQADPVTETVREGVAVAGLHHDVPRGGVDRAQVGAHREGVPTGPLRPAYDVMDLTLPVGRGAADDHRASAVGVVAAV